MAKKQTKPAVKKRILKAARFRIMPLTMAMLGLLLVAKLNDVFLGGRQLLAIRNAQAESAPKEAPAAPAAEAPKEEGHAADAEKKDKETGGHGEKHDESGKPPPEPKTFGEGKMTIKQVEELKAKGNVQPYSQTELDLLQNLTKRREELDERAKDLDMKSSVLDATEKRINDKIGEMKVLQIELSKVVEEYKKQQDKEISSLVKIYESMKPGDAANIFNEMDMPILLEVIDTMSERKVAPILAGMDPKRARDVTQELAELRKGRQRLDNAATQATTPGK